PAPRFSAAVTSGTIKLKDATCPALHAALQASEKGVPFMPLRGLLGSDILRYRDDWKVIDSPFGDNDPIVLLPAIKPDVALIHAPMADDFGNIWIGRQRELATMAHAADKTIATVEKIRDGNLLDDPVLAAGTLPGFYVDAVAVAERGAWPLGLPDHYGVDADHLALYARMAASEAGFAEYLDRYVYEKRAALCCALPGGRGIPVSDQKKRRAWRGGPSPAEGLLGSAERLVLRPAAGTSQTMTLETTA